MERKHITLRIHPKVVDWMFEEITILEKQYPNIKSVSGVVEALAKEQGGTTLRDIEPGKYERDSK